MTRDLINKDVWTQLRSYSPARIGIGHVGGALPTSEVLDLQRCHAAARDAIYHTMDVEALADRLAPLEPVLVESRASDRQTYIRRPDLGRLLSDESAARLIPDGADLAVVLCDGLSPLAVEDQGWSLALQLRARLPFQTRMRLVLAQQGRVALGDDIAARLKAAFVIVLIGERPGLTVADSVGAYLTYQPYVGRLDSERNCISNIRPGGVATEEAVNRIIWLFQAALAICATGTVLKDDYRPAQAKRINP